MFRTLFRLSIDEQPAELSNRLDLSIHGSVKYFRQISSSLFQVLRSLRCQSGVWQAQGLGAGQSWQDVTASRALGRLYINDTARPIMVSALADGVDWGYPARLIIKGTVIVGFYSAYYGWPAGVSGVVPPGASYMVDIAGASGYLYKWIELR